MTGPLTIVFWGVRGSLPVCSRNVLHYGGSTSCIEIIADNGTHLICDGGSGLYALSNKYMAEGIPKNLAVFITHPHWDHIQGLPFFVPAFIPGNKIVFYGCNQGSLSLRDALQQQMQTPYFPVKLTNWKADIAFTPIGETTVEVNGVTVTSAYAEHPGMTLGYRIEYKGKKVVYLPDNEPFAKFAIDKVCSCSAAAGDEMDMKEVFLEDQKKNFFGFINDADLLIHDAQYTPEEYAVKVGWGHSCFEITVKVAAHGNVRHLALFHHDPSRTDAAIDEIVRRSQEIAASRGSSLQVSAASENVPITITA
ncbi:MAG: MBL fold metallo-hydrolase [Pseudomonadota bacterium]